MTLPKSSEHSSAKTISKMTKSLKNVLNSSKLVFATARESDFSKTRSNSKNSKLSSLFGLLGNNIS